MRAVVISIALLAVAVSAVPATAHAPSRPAVPFTDYVSNASRIIATYEPPRGAHAPEASAAAATRFLDALTPG